MKQRGLIKELSKADRSYYEVNDVMEMFGVSKTKAYDMVHVLRQDLVDAGALSSVYPRGKVPKKYFDEKCMVV